MFGLLALVGAQLLPDGTFHTDGVNIVSQSGAPVRLVGFSWEGLEGSTLLQPLYWEQVYGRVGPSLLVRVLEAIIQKGFNVIRIPLAVETVHLWQTGHLPGQNGEESYPGYADPDPNLQSIFLFCGSSSPWTRPEDCGPDHKPTQLHLVRHFLQVLQHTGLRVIWDLHSLYPNGFATPDREKRWFHGTITEEQYIQAAEWLVNPTTPWFNSSAVIGIDLANDRHGACGDPEGANWTAYRRFIEAAGQRVLAAAGGEILLFVQGIECHNGVSTGWGGNLRSPASGTEQISFGQPYSNRLVYAPHEYGPERYPGPWFCSGQFSYSAWLTGHVLPNWLELWVKRSALIVGSWEKSSADTDTARIWFNSTIRLINSLGLSHIFWSWGNLFGSIDNATNTLHWKTEVVDAIFANLTEPTAVGNEKLPNCPPDRTATQSQPPPSPTASASDLPATLHATPTPEQTEGEKMIGLISVKAMIGMTAGAVGAVVIAVIVLICLFRPRKDMKDLEQELVENPDADGGVKPSGDQAIQF